MVRALLEASSFAAARVKRGARALGRIWPPGESAKLERRADPSYGRSAITYARGYMCVRVCMYMLVCV